MDRQPYAARAIPSLLHRSDNCFARTGHWLVYRSRYLACSDGEACAQSLPNWLVKAALIVATILVMAVLGFDLIEPFLFNT